MTDQNTTEATTPTIGKLALALSKAQGMLKGAAKDSENPHFRSKYADLASVWDACREALSKNEIAIIQPLSGGPDTITITTILVHSSGESVYSALTLRPTKPDPQGIGSAATYGRRYGLAAMVGVAPEDDDGNAASQPVKGANTKEAVQKEVARVTKATYLLNALDGAVPTSHGTPAAFLTALGKALKSADDPAAVWESNYEVFLGIEQVAKAQIDQDLYERCGKAAAYADTLIHDANNPELKGAGMP